MSRIIISWLAFNKDFSKVGNGFQINVSGPTIQIHEHLFTTNKYDFHFLLQCNPAKNSELDRKIKAMQNHIAERYPLHKYHVELLNLSEDELSNYEVVAATLRSFLTKVDVNEEVDVITGTGSSIMHMAWVALFYSMELKFNLFLMHHDPVRFPNPIPVPLSKSKILDQKLKEFHLNASIPDNIVRDDLIVETYSKAEAFANAIEQNILILGETGTGKDLLAKHIWENSPLFDKPYEAINCAALPDDNLLHSELFGHVAGSFTGANKKRDGLFQKCNGGTLFMDEVGDMPLNTQQNLLRALENKEVKPLGSDEVIKNVRVRIIAATNADLWEKCVDKKFRWDLYYRLCDCELELKPFSVRNMSGRKKIISDVIAQAEKQWGRQLNFTEDAKKVFYEHAFPGNFRELRRTVNSLIALQLKSIRLSDLPNRFFRDTVNRSDNRKETEKQELERIYREQNYNMSATAKKWGHSNPHLLKKKMENLGIEIRKK